jgi:hypothetical protein
MVSDESREEDARKRSGLHSPVKLSRGGGTDAVHVEVRTSQASLGLMAVAKCALGAGPGAQEGSVVATVGAAERK